MPRSTATAKVYEIRVSDPIDEILGPHWQPCCFSTPTRLTNARYTVSESRRKRTTWLGSLLIKEIMEDVLENFMTRSLKRPFVSFVREDIDGSNLGGGTVVGPRNMRGNQASPASPRVIM